MKLIVAIVHNDDAGPVVDALLQREHRVTRINSSGGFLRRGNATLLIGVEPADVDGVLAVIKDTAKTRTQPASDRSKGADQVVEFRAATIFVINLDDVFRI